MVEIRCFGESDLPVLMEMLKQPSSEQRLPYTHYYNGDFLCWLHERGIEVLMAEVDGKVVGSVAYNDGYWGEEIEWLLSDQGGDRRFVEDALVEEAEKFVKRGAVFIAVAAGSPKIADWTRRGYFLNGGLNLMVASLAEPKVITKIPGGVVLRSLKPEEEDKFIELVNSAFGWKRVKIGDTQKWKITSPPFDEEWIRVAEVDGKLVSVVVAKPDVGYNVYFNAKRGYLGPAATLEEQRRKNLASALTLDAMNFLSKQGMDSVCLFTSESNTASTGLLEKIGFRVEINWKFMRKQF
jgi:ribosomal protein S18 acetylase RimI-like enzyme